MFSNVALCIFLGLVIFTLSYVLRNPPPKAGPHSFLGDLSSLHHQTDLASYSSLHTRLFVNRSQEQRHLVYVRIPKTGSSTITILIWRFGLSRNLTFLLPRKGAEGNLPKLTGAKFYLPRGNNTFDLMANHVRFDYSNIQPYFSNDTVYISLIREPLSHLTSTLHVLNGEIKVPESPEENIVSRFLRKPKLYEPKLMDHSFTKNPITYYFGLERSQSESIPQILDLIQSVDRRFLLVMILDKFDESLILLRRLMGWTIRDVLYIKSNVNTGRPRNFTFSHLDKDRLCGWSLADCLFYEYFSGKLNLAIKQQNNSFTEEVTVFKKYLSRTETFCRYANDSDDVVRLDHSAFYPAVTLTSADCRFMRMKGLAFLDNIRQLQNKNNTRTAT